MTGKQVALTRRSLVAAGTAGAVRHRQDQRYAAKEQATYDQQQAAYEQGMADAAAAQAAPPPAAQPAAPDYAAELEKLAQLKAQGIITEEDFEAKKRQLLGI